MRRQAIDFESAQALRELPVGIDAEAVRKQCTRILSDSIFSPSKRCSGLLEYIVENTLTGDHECLKERIIGIEQFGRSPDYSTGSDAIVRSTVVEVRKRLSRYFACPDHAGELRIELPPGSYIAEFHLPEIAQPETISHVDIDQTDTIKDIEFAQPDTKSEIEVGQPVGRLYPLRPLHMAVLCATICILVLGFWGMRRILPVSSSERFWSPLLSSPAPALIVIGVPVVPRLHDARDGDIVHLGQYITQQSNYPLAEISVANALNAFLGRHGKQAAIRLAPSTSLSDLKTGPTIVLGDDVVNQWQRRLGSGLRFQFKGDQTTQVRWIEDSNDRDNRSWAMNLSLPYDQIRSEFALITRKYDSSTGQWWIGIGGETVLGTIASEQMLLDPAGSDALVSQLPKGWEVKNVQIVVEFDMVDGSLGASHVVKSYVW